MSNWTHVAAVVRVDSIFADRHALGGIATQAFGKPCLWESPMSVWEDQKKHPYEYLYMGSEGSLNMVVNEEADTSSICLGTITIFGDLRDTNSAEDVVVWFKECLDKLDKNAFVRQAVITAQNEQNDTVTWANR